MTCFRTKNILILLVILITNLTFSQEPYLKIRISSENGDITGHKISSISWKNLGTITPAKSQRDLLINSFWTSGECEYGSIFYFTYKVYVYKNNVLIHASNWNTGHWSYQLNQVYPTDIITLDVVYETITTCIGNIQNHAVVVFNNSWGPAYLLKDFSSDLSNFNLLQNYPNPFNPSTSIDFTLAVDSRVTMKVFDVLGQEVMTLINGNYTAGSHKVNFDASGLNSGVYVYRIDATGNDGKTFSASRKMILNK